ncbi:U4/U6 small nuclear ribonucleoprotein prp4 [Entophlyctis luteolus]|nr:U4/U6 small nuclear ribonucleoprotein prp4 [Entophlyctis luteolus]
MVDPMLSPTAAGLHTEREPGEVIESLSPEPAFPEHVDSHRSDSQDSRKRKISNSSESDSEDSSDENSSVAAVGHPCDGEVKITPSREVSASNEKDKHRRSKRSKHKTNGSSKHKKHRKEKSTRADGEKPLADVSHRMAAVALAIVNEARTLEKGSGSNNVTVKAGDTAAIMGMIPGGEETIRGETMIDPATTIPTGMKIPVLADAVANGMILTTADNLNEGKEVKLKGLGTATKFPVIQPQYSIKSTEHKLNEKSSQNLGSVRSVATVSDHIIESKRSDTLNSENPASKQSQTQQQTLHSSKSHLTLNPETSALDNSKIVENDLNEGGFEDQDSEEKIIEERRKRRQAILQKYNSTQNSESIPSTGLVAVSAVPASEPLSERPEVQDQVEKSHFSLADPAASRSPSGLQEAEISAADYDPNQDGADDEQHRLKRVTIAKLSSADTNGTKSSADSKPNEKSKIKKKVEVEFDMFAEDDMFNIDEPAASNGTTHILESAVVVRSSDNPALTDNWDDAEGYYRIILGEVLDGRYHVYQNLGKGVFSSVVKARDTKNGDVDVAIKLIRNNDSMYRAGMKEIGILKKLMDLDPDDKKHVIRLIRHFEHKSHLCMVFESMNMNLREVLKKFGKDIGLNIKAVRIYAQQLLLALSLLRKGNILHADIKPDNILVADSKNTLKLCDLGSASDASENEITPYLVSRFYRAPEIILGLPYDFALDMWSIACTLYELYTGKILFPGRSNNQMLRFMQEVKGPFPKKMLRKGQFTSLHFDDNLVFQQIDVDKLSGQTTARPLTITKPLKDLKTRLLTSGSGKEEKELMASFVDFLEKSLVLAPEGRMTVKEALMHPFILPGNGITKV